MRDTALPTVKRHYQSALIDSERWNRFTPRDDDIIVTTSYKAGTTWVQGICGALVFQSAEPPGTLDDRSPWLDALFGQSRMWGRDSTHSSIAGISRPTSRSTRFRISRRPSTFT